MKNKNSTATKKPGSGRTKGSFSFVSVPLSDLVNKFNDQSTPIVISRKFAETIGITNVTAKAAKDTFTSIQGTEASAKVATTVTTFDDDETETETANNQTT